MMRWFHKKPIAAAPQAPSAIFREMYGIDVIAPSCPLGSCEWPCCDCPDVDQPSAERMRQALRDRRSELMSASPGEHA